MIKKGILLLLLFVISGTVLGCSNQKDKENVEATTEVNSETEEVAQSSDSSGAEDKATNKSLTLPDDFPADFPLPESIEITEIDDDSDENRYSFGIRFNFDPNIDMDATFKMYDDYAKQLGYNTIAEGEEVFAEGIFQFGAVSKTTASDMFLITLKSEGTMFGDIQVKVSK